MPLALLFSYSRISPQLGLSLRGTGILMLYSITLEFFLNFSGQIVCGYTYRNTQKIWGTYFAFANSHARCSVEENMPLELKQVGNQAGVDF